MNGASFIQMKVAALSERFAKASFNMLNTTLLKMRLKHLICPLMVGCGIASLSAANGAANLHVEFWRGVLCVDV